MIQIRPTLVLVLTAVLAAAAFGQKKDELIPAVPTDLATAAYPFVAIESGVSGEVHVEVDINTKGRVTAARVLSGPGFTCPDVKNVAVVAIRNAATEAAMKTKYKPARLNGKAVVSTARLMFGFTPPSRTTQEVEKEKSVKVTGHVTATNSKGGVLNHKAISLPPPTYPNAAHSLRVSGLVKVKVLIDTDGIILSAEPIEGHPLLKPAARTAACKAVFEPTLLEGQPVKVSGIISYNFVP